MRQLETVKQCVPVHDVQLHTRVLCHEAGVVAQDMGVQSTGNDGVSLGNLAPEEYELEVHLFRLELGLAFDDFRIVLKLPKMLFVERNRRPLYFHDDALEDSISQ